MKTGFTSLHTELLNARSVPSADAAPNGHEGHEHVSRDGH